MNSKLKFSLPIACCLILSACQQKPSANHEMESGDTSSEPTAGMEGVWIEGSENGPYILYNASTFKESEEAKKLKELVFYENPKTQEEMEEAGRFEAITHLYPLGWSKTGDFAFAQHSVGYEGGHEISYTIRNMNSGKDLWSKARVLAMVSDTSEFYSEMGTDTVILVKENEPEAALFKHAWLMDEKEVLAALEKAGIVFQPSGEFLKQPQYKEVSFEAETVQTQSERDPVEYYLKSNKFAPKLLGKDYFEARETKVIGVIKSPYSETIAVVCRQNRQIFEMTYGIVPILAGYNLD